MPWIKTIQRYQEVAFLVGYVESLLDKKKFKNSLFKEESREDHEMCGLSEEDKFIEQN